MKNNIQILLFVLTILFFATAVTVKNAININDILDIETKNLSNIIRNNEDQIDEIFQDSIASKTFANSERYPLQVQEIAKKTRKENIYLFLFKNSKPIFWSTNIYVPDTDAGLKEGTSFISADNYSFLVKKKKITEELNLLALVPIERQFNKDYIPDPDRSFFGEINETHLQIADFRDQDDIKNIYTKDNKYLFSVKLKNGKYDNIYLKIQLFCWVLGTICIIILITNICTQIARSGRPFISIITIITTFIIIRIVDLETNWLSQISNYKLFSQHSFTLNYITPNLWSFLINSIALFWILRYILYIKKYIPTPEILKNRYTKSVIYLTILVSIYFIYDYLFGEIAQLITQSSLSTEDLITVFFEKEFTVFHLIIYSLIIFSVLLICDIIYNISKILNFKVTTNLNIQLLSLVIALFISGIYEDFSLTNILIGLLIMMRTFDDSIIKYNSIYTHIITILIISSITTFKYAEALNNNNEQNMKLLLLNLETDEDVETISQFKEIESRLKFDNQLKRLIQIGSTNPNFKVIDNYLKKNYLSSYFFNYELTASYFYNGTSLQNSLTISPLIEFREKLIYNAVKVNNTNSFYKAKIGFKNFSYFTLASSGDNHGNSFSVILNLRNQNNKVITQLPFLRSYIHQDNIKSKFIDDYNYAIYKNGVLIDQNGNFTYPGKDPYALEKTKEYFTNNDFNDYQHIIYKPDAKTTLIVSKPIQSYWQFITVLSIAFLYLYVIINIIRLTNHLSPIFLKKDMTLIKVYLRMRYMIAQIRYSSRIQSLVISSVLIAIIISGVISFYSIKIQTEIKRNDQKINHIADIASNLQNIVSQDTTGNYLSALHKIMKTTTEVSVTNFNLYDRQGKLFFTTQPSLYNHNIISSYINPDAFLDMNVLKKSETLFDEQIIDFHFQSAYATIKDGNFRPVAYLGIPYFNHQEIENQNINILFKTILNIYTIILIIFAFLSLYISNKITEPLQMIRKKLSQTNISDKPNESLYWEKDDEIGLLVKEYNYMLVKLEDHSKQLRNAERESVWREMAQQVAHEIKNPLTPMKLGIQQLTRSFNDNDSRFPERFKKISDSFIEQIEALSNIASEFSAFAKLPETNYVVLNLIEKVNKSMHVYNHMPNVFIEMINETECADNIKVFGDRDQIIRTFNNLIKNAIEATLGRRKPKIKIYLKTYDEHNVLVEVQDNGFGIPEEAIPKIFKPNFTTKSSGTGLGLAFVKQTIVGMGGTISYRTYLNRGTTFFLIIPLYKGPKKMI